MPTIYCGNGGCGAAVDYTGLKPSTCPKCKQSFSAVFTKAAATDYEESLQDNASAHRPTLPKPKKSKFLPPGLKSRFDRKATAASTIMNPPEDETLLEVGTEEEFIDESADKSDVAALAEELKASLNEEDIIVNTGDEDDQKVKFKWYGPKIEQ